MSTIVAVQLLRGRWPITDEFTGAHYGTATQATVRTAVMLGVLIGVPCLVAALLVAVARRRRGGIARRAVPAETSSPCR